MKKDKKCEYGTKWLKRGKQKHEYEYELEDGEYWYDITFVLGDKGHGIIIMPSGVWIDWFGGASTHTNITPESLFPNRKKLKKKHLLKIIDIVESTKCEGKYHTAEEMEKKYYRWMNLEQPWSRPTEESE